MKTAGTCSAAVVRFPIVHAPLAPQLELIGMHRGYPRVRIEPTAEGWAEVTFERGDQG